MIGPTRQTLLGWLGSLEHAFGGAWKGAPTPACNLLLLQHPLALGTAVHTTPLVRALHDNVPGCRVMVAGSGLGFEVFRHHPLLERVIRTPSPYNDLLGAARSIRRQAPFGREPYVVLTSNGNQRTRVALEAMLSGGQTRVGFTEVPQLYRVGLRFDARQSQIANNLRIVEALGYEAPASGYEPEVFYTRADLETARRLLQESHINLSQPIAVFVTQSSPTQQKSWRQERFQEVVAWMHREWRIQALFVGSASERAAIDGLCEGLTFSAANFAGQTSIAELCALLSLCDVGVTLDTGTLHLGRAVGLPMVILAPAWSPPVEWLPVGDPRFEILKPFNLDRMPDEYVIDEVSVGDVRSAISSLLLRFPLLTRKGRRGLLA